MYLNQKSSRLVNTLEIDVHNDNSSYKGNTLSQQAKNRVKMVNGISQMQYSQSQPNIQMHDFQTN